MYETLKALSIRLDSPAQSLTKDAIAQMLIKIVYKSPTSLSRSQILDQYKAIVGWDDAKSSEVSDILDSLRNTEIQYNKGHFYLSSAKRKAIDKIKEESDNRFQYVVDTYLKPYYSSDDAVKSWFQDMLITFFTSYSKEWIADLSYNQNTVSNSIENVIEQITRRTKSNKEICKDDVESLINSFKRILTEKDQLLGPLLWEYGTAQFPAQLLKNGNNIDKLTVDTFKESVCLLDTNILMHLALYGTDYSKQLASIERIFHSLGIKVKYLYITKEEYTNTVISKSNEVMHLLDKFSPEVVKEADNQFVQAAQLFCSTKEDYDRYYRQLLTLPSVVDKTVMVSLLDNDKELCQKISEAQNSEEKKTLLNSIFRSFTGKDKKEHALIHDVGLIAGADYLRKTGKYFILTQDSSIINYAKQYPFINGLPISIKIETLLNVLAVNSYNNSCENYVPLFASIIRGGFQPKSSTFKLQDLQYIMEKEQFVSQLPNESVLSIVSDISKRRLLGESDENICKELNRKVMSEKFKVVSDLDATRLQLTAERNHSAIVSKENEAGKKALIDNFRNEKNREINKNIRNCWIGGISLIGLISIFIWVIVWLKEYFSFNQLPLTPTIFIAIITDIAVTLWGILKGILPRIYKLKSTRKQVVEDYVNEQIIKIYG